MQEQILNYREALDRLGGDSEFLNELLRELLAQFDEIIIQIKKAVENKNYEDLKTLSHSLKGASANLNVNRMAEHFFKLESLGANNSVNGAEEVIQAVFLDRNDLETFLNNN